MNKKIYTSFFANVRNLPENEYFLVCIRGDHPEWYDGFIYKPLIPKKWWLLCRLFLQGKVPRNKPTKNYSRTGSFRTENARKWKKNRSHMW